MRHPSRLHRPLVAAASAILLAAGLGVATAPGSDAQENIRSGLVSVRDGVVIIDVPIHFAGMRCVGRPDCEPPIVEYAEIEAWLAAFEADVEAFFKAALAGLEFEDCYTFEVDVQTTYADGGFATAGEWVDSHHIWLNFDPGIRSMTYTASDSGLASQDDAKAWEFYSTGDWAFFDMTPSDYGHEVMHIFGLGDDYRPVYGPNGELEGAIDRPGREGTLMDSGDLMDQDLVDRLGKILRQAEELPNCWVANLDLQTHQRLASGDTCEVTGKAQGKVLVAADGRISGVLDAEEIESCTFGFDRTRSDLVLVLDGTASGSELTVHHTGSQVVSTTTGYFPLVFISADGAFEPVPIPITAPGRAHGSVTRDRPNNFTITLTSDLECLTCQRAVG